jgi:hypothetical protein
MAALPRYQEQLFMPEKLGPSMKRRYLGHND